MIVWSFAAPALATSCKEDGGNDECRDLIQLTEKYGGAYDACDGHGLEVRPPYEGSCVFSSHDAMLQHTKQEMMCHRPFCEEPNVTTQGPYVNAAPYPIGYQPVFMIVEDIPSSPLGEGIEWRYRMVRSGVCHEGPSYTWTGGHRCAPLICPTGFVRHTVSSDPLIEICVRSQIECCHAGPGGEGGNGRSFGNPIFVPELEKRQVERDATLNAEFLVSLSRSYSSNGDARPVGTRDIAPPKPVAQYVRSMLGGGWRFDFEAYVSVSSGFSTSTTTVRFVRPNGAIRYFKLVGNALVGDGDETGVASRVFSGSTLVGYQYQTSVDILETYGTDGRLQSISRHGQVNNFTYDGSGRLSEIEGYAGRKLLFSYAGVSPSVSSITLPDGATIAYAYNDQGNVTSVTYPSSEVRRYEYQSNYEPQKLARIIDENNTTFATFGYNASDRAISTEHAGGTNRYAVTELPNMRFRVEGPLGDLHEQTYQLVAGKYRQTEISAKCPNCGPFRKRFLDATTGLPSRAIDFREVVTDYEYGTRGLETLRREGQAYLTTPQCPAGSTYFSGNYGSMCTTGTCWGSTPFPGSSSAAPLGYTGQHYRCNSTDGPVRTTTTVWHADYHQPTERRVKNSQGQTEALVRWAYNSRGQVAAKCVIDADDAAALGYACSGTSSPPAGAKVRRWTYQYCESIDVALPNSACPILGLRKSANGPRLTSDAGMGVFDDITTYSYYSSTDESGCGTFAGPCRRKGDLWKVRNALDHVVETATYDKNGRPVRLKDVNGTITDLTYHERGWLWKRTVRAKADGSAYLDDAVTEFAYDPAGNVARVTQPDGAYLDYTYDAAHRLTDVVDNLGDRMHYTLDAAGNRVKEETYDASYNAATPSVGLKRSMSRVYNQLGRLVKTQNASLVPTRNAESFVNDGYDGNGNSESFLDGLGVETRQAFDPLNRLMHTIQDHLGSDPETAGATTSYDYDARDNLITVTDPSTLPTTYTYDGLSNLTDLDSPDTGHTDYAYDNAGNRTSQTDARLKTSTYAYDALNRLIGIAYPATSFNVTFAYDQPNGTTGCGSSFPIGKLTTMTDASGSTTYCYDRRGNVTRKTQIAMGKMLVVGYTYTKADRLATLTYPDGVVATYTRDSTGRETGLSTSYGGMSTTIVSNATYYPLGPMNVLTFGNGRTLTKTYDNDYTIDKVVSSAAGGLVLDFTTDVMGNTVAASDTVNAASPTRKYVYDRLYRLTRVDDGSNVMQEDYGYNKTGDRTLKQFAGQSAEVYTYLTGTHRLANTGGGVRSYDANGNTTNRGNGIALYYDDRNRLSGFTIPEQSGSRVSPPLTPKVSETSNADSILQNRNVGYVYNGIGQRVSKFDSASMTLPLVSSFDEAGQLIYEASSDPSVFVAKKYLYLDGVPVVASSFITGWNYVETDHLGTPRVAVDYSTNTTQGQWSFFGSAFGEHQPTGIFDLNLRYPGQSYDVESGLHYNYFRDYEPATGRYVESDPIGLRGGVNTFLYGRANSLRFIDPRGLFTVDGSCENCDGVSSSGDEVRSAAGSACTELVKRVTNAALTRCILLRCENVTILCQEDFFNCPPGKEGTHWTYEIGGDFWKIGIPEPRVNLCVTNNRGSPVPLGDVVLHELAHSCGWGHGDREGVHDTNRYSNTPPWRNAY